MQRCHCLRLQDSDNHHCLDRQRCCCSAVTNYCSCHIYSASKILDYITIKISALMITGWIYHKAVSAGKICSSCLICCASKIFHCINSALSALIIALWIWQKVFLDAPSAVHICYCCSLCYANRISDYISSAILALIITDWIWQMPVFLYEAQ